MPTGGSTTEQVGVLPRGGLKRKPSGAYLGVASGTTFAHYHSICCLPNQSLQAAHILVSYLEEISVKCILCNHKL